MLNVMKNIFALLMFYLFSCIPSKAGQPEDAQDMNRQAAKAVLICGKKYIEEIDDHISDKEVIALELANVCKSEFERHRESFSSTLKGNPRADEFIEQTKSDDFKIFVFLPIVLEYRNKFH